MKKVLSLIFAVIIFFSISLGDVIHANAESAEMHTCYFYSPEGNLLSSVEVAEGSQLSPFVAPWVDGMMFMYWYSVDYLLQGDSTQPYGFDSPVTGSLYLKAYYVQIVQNEEEPAAEDPVDEEPVADEPTAEDPAAEEPAVEDPAVEELTAEDPVAEEPTEEMPVVEEPAAEDPVAEEPVVEEPVVEEPAAEDPAAGKPLTEEPAAEEPAVEEPAAEEPETGKTLTEEPATEEQLTPEERRVLLKEEIDATNPNRKISFYASWGEKAAPEIGDEITIHAELSGYEGLNYNIRWQVKYSASEEWCDLDVTGDAYKLVISLQNLDWQFRVAVDIIEAE